ncbi:glycyl-radical enzyme activating protein [Mesoterricola silvestris]|uniref:Glycyl-radical enzyme activating protein n=1 Tax=Mesoterricola silvestris TaxID=2927979 RepID=A0AA48KB90_9BACT|nr:glycyl-radical enzyme activating protein [Mesoterricola silvestris]BDU74092.1 glycyl-radical enzyme activating protein [Mesoterricola silvestris]
MKGRIFNIQRFSLHDGPGLRTTVFMKGCPLDCAWCHNPESQSPSPEPVFQEGLCIRCGTCHPFPEEAKAEACPTGARRMLGRDVEVDELVEEVLRDRIFFDESGGGVTFSGGEPLLQAGFVARALAALRARGVHTALDTCGLPALHLPETAAQADLVLFDLKHMDGPAHRRLTGVDNAEILEALSALGRVHPQVRVRMPVIPGLNDDEANLDATARFVAGLPGARLDLLPYHATGSAKFARLGRDYALGEVLPPTPERMEQLAQRFRNHGIQVGGLP